MFLWRDSESRDPINFVVGILFPLACIALVAMIVAKIMGAHMCASHMWNLTTGCVAI